ncbi:atp synthase : Flagellar biosynthesis/type III secretory pathway ATPase OS=Caldanaerobacter subterraneus subsp. tengcongensis (strain DSM 15242 / JCM 11007 / NBRC 100824 / MB4) GN=FliI PE=4 SV=1: ATP-synt_ab_N: ATP-synt_ab [Gemmataceae bacterium]|jgi:flagellum-specific ATP synthase|nr:atp synthase : Flagellar biosynthesis/type III secretory pathway ATPase OS=Caldanaerobacter subterraneus subsp. tengcongensis (strain DSM 15242 / JCM 11007 / NBRC 100824 / MB4) GN=FliI PE=4 SV=1: ATP-synt_ab_N: ATP-synt_ab [Gemmataceae bacterium]VTT97898.1 atp synthase : Flagellar biosynthesis/type III secretory pathway ATPase OS=Caldanaerobacter subterraneus subsp. tengcongensis (strain DSM 15242 / JCM 11007 / NBRC 100824 / MB4) GN=FliI PE=4 SV=1: ATP-synt_ab_N: ATP-synt_ab [Gemmataceae bacter
MLGLDLSAMNESITKTPLYRMGGRLRSVTGVMTCNIPAAVGDHCAIIPKQGDPVLAEVIGFEKDLAYLVPFDSAENLQPGMPVIRKGSRLKVPTGNNLLGRVIDGLGRPLDEKGPLLGCPLRPVNGPAPAALVRQRIREPFVTGIRAIDSVLTCGLGQRVGIFAGSGVGKSTLLGEIARGSNADVNVIALIGERGREVGPFLEDCLGPAGMARSVVVVATCEQTPLMRLRASQAAIAIADSFRESGANVLFMIDSLTRLAMAQRELGLLLGEPPSARGYTPSVFQVLANTIERLGNAAVGGITALLTVLVDGGDLDEPISDAVRSLVDGHIVLDRKIAERGFYPAIDVSRSVSRVATDVVDRPHALAARKLRSILATHAEVQDLIRIGAYSRGSSPQVDKAIELMPRVEKFLKQDVGERSNFEQTRAALSQLISAWPF